MAGVGLVDASLVIRRQLPNPDGLFPGIAPKREWGRRTVQDSTVNDHSNNHLGYALLW